MTHLKRVEENMKAKTSLSLKITLAICVVAVAGCVSFKRYPSVPPKKITFRFVLSDGTLLSNQAVILEQLSWTKYCFNLVGGQECGGNERELFNGTLDQNGEVKVLVKYSGSIMPSSMYRCEGGAYREFSPKDYYVTVPVSEMRADEPVITVYQATTSPAGVKGLGSCPR